MSISDAGAAAAEVRMPPAGRRVMVERAPRQRTCLGGKLVYSDGTDKAHGAFTLDCTVRDISAGGAKVIIGYQRPLPANLYLIIVKHCIAHQAEVVWMKYPARGLKFSGTYPLDEPLAKDLLFLRKLWNDLTERDGGYLQ